MISRHLLAISKRGAMLVLAVVGAGCARSGGGSGQPMPAPVVFGAAPAAPRVEAGLWRTGLPSEKPFVVPPQHLALVVHVIQPEWTGKPRDFGAVESTYAVPVLSRIEVQTAQGQTLPFSRSQYLKWPVRVAPQPGVVYLGSRDGIIRNWAVFLPKENLPRRWKQIRLSGIARSQFQLHPNAPQSPPPVLPAYINTRTTPLTIDSSAAWSLVWKAPASPQR